MKQPKLNLSFSFSFEDLYSTKGLQRLDKTFLKYLAVQPFLLEKLIEYRENKPAHNKEIASFLLELSPYLEDFIAELFDIKSDIDNLRQAHNELAPLYTVKRLFVQRKSHQKYGKTAENIDEIVIKPQLEKLVSDFNYKINLPHTVFNLPPSANNRKNKIDTDYLYKTNPQLHFELYLAHAVNEWQKNEQKFENELDLSMQYCAWGLKYYHLDSGYTGILFKQAQKLDFNNLLHSVNKNEENNINSYKIDTSHIRQRSSNSRQAFSLTDNGTNLFGGLDEANYCIHCHNQGKDSCSKGLQEKISSSENIEYKKSTFGIKLAGCPLEEKISEFHAAKTQGFAVSALAIICIDNPMAAATGHRICNDCMKACIYQKQTPVDIPQAETQTLKSVLNLPWGFEIYSLLTRWNPLNIERPYPQNDTNKDVLIVGMGPAGYTLSHHLMNDGHKVVGIDGLKIEPLPAEICGKDMTGGAINFEPVYNVENLLEDLDKRSPAGFGGVAEYGITVRWDKNFLKIIRLLLERRKQFALFGGVRFGSTITAQTAFDMGFDHIALAMGAGKPTILDIPNGLAKGVRTASDFLMGLQLSGAAKFDSISNMQIRLPIVVIGGGLTAIDTATESMAYYAVQVEKFAQRYKTLVSSSNEQSVRQTWTPEEMKIAEEFLLHADEIKQERIKAHAKKREANIAQLIQNWGGVTVAYRKQLIDSPAYILNHEEVQKALEEGISFAECLSPHSLDIDECGNVSHINFKKQIFNMEHHYWKEGETITFNAKTIFIAAGTQPNTVLAREDMHTFVLDGKYFQAIDENGNKVKPAYAVSKPQEIHVLLHKTQDNKFISYFGDLHPSYFGNVVKAMGSAKQGYPIITKVLKQVQDKNIKFKNEAVNHQNMQDNIDKFTAEQKENRYNYKLQEANKVKNQNNSIKYNHDQNVNNNNLSDDLNKSLRANVYEVKRLTPNIVEIIIQAPFAAQQFQPGQFYRLQNFESLAHRDMKTNTILAMEGIALTGAWVDKQKGLVSCIALEMGGSSNLCASLKAGEPVVLMGPTGTPTHIQGGETVMLAGGGLGNAVLFSIGAALREAGSKVLYFAGYKKLQDRYKIAEIEAAADTIVWCCDEAPGFYPNTQRPQDKSFTGNIVQAIKAYADGSLGETLINTLDVDRIIAIGSDKMMAAVGMARHGILKPYLKTNHFAIASINSPMQCMMKEICAQCLQPHKKADGTIEYVFSCFNQDQDLDKVDFDALNARLGQNTLQEKITKNWVEYCKQNI